MRTRNLLYIATAFAAIACAKDITTESTNDVQQEVRLVPMTFTAGADDASDTESKVALGGENFKSVLWSEGDQIKVFDGKNDKLPAFELVSGIGKTSGVFSGKVSEGLPESTVFYALYPYQENAVFNESITVGSTTYEMQLLLLYRQNRLQYRTVFRQMHFLQPHSQMQKEILNFRIFLV